MSKYRFSLIIAASVLTGIFIGAIGAFWFWYSITGEINMANLCTKTQLDIVTKVSVLERFRGDKYDEGVKMLEMLLDGDLVTVGELVRNGYTFNADTRRAMKLERRAREISGYEPAKTRLSEIRETFRLLSVDSAEIGSQPGATELHR